MLTMATTKTTVSQSKPSMLKLLHQRYDVVNEIYNQLDEESVLVSRGGCGLRNSHRKDGMDEAFEQAEALQQCLLREQPESWEDALILAAHATSIGADIGNIVDKYRERECEKLRLGLENLLTFLAGETGVELTGYMESTISVCRRTVLIRTGRTDQDAWLAGSEVK